MLRGRVSLISVTLRNACGTAKCENSAKCENAAKCEKQSTLKCENSAKCEKSTLNVKKEGPLNVKKYLR